MARPFLSILILTALLAPLLSFSQSSTEALIISGGTDRDSNHVRYENNVRLYSDILSERGFSKANTKVLFNEGIRSEVVDPDSVNAKAQPQYGVPSAFVNTFRKNNITDLIDGAADEKNVEAEFARLEKSAKAGTVKKVLLFSTDHGTANTSDPARSYISLAGSDKLSYEAQDKFVSALNAAGAKAILVGDQCYSGHNMGIALKNSNACAFASAAPGESSYSLTRELADIKKPVARLGYTTYAYFFGCALHQAGSAENQAEQDCDKINADFNKDGKVSFAEAHNFAVARMDPLSVPQISSQVYAQSLLAPAVGKAFFDPEAVGACLIGGQTLSALAKQMGALVNPALQLAIRDRLQMQREFLSWLSNDADFLTLIKAAATDSPESKAQKVEEAFEKFEHAHEKILGELKASLAKRNDARVRREAMRSAVLASLSAAPDSPLPAHQAKMAEAAAKLEEATTPAKRQLAQNMFNRAKQEIKYYVDRELELPAHAEAYAALKNEIDALAETKKGLEEDLAANLSSGGEVRRYRQAYRGYQAEVSVLTNGTPEQKAKLVQLYECEDETL
ncbi:MAG: hypothetical protein EOP11_13695 [Proteobacteria bacterium]|nr:MAG: hypothetical protein EOP11_13695 [Pseudomonadota bacterium]